MLLRIFWHMPDAKNEIASLVEGMCQIVGSL